MTDPIVDAVCAKLQSRSAGGLKKYGTTLADNAATVKEKLVHIQEELMDGANYVEWLLQDYFSYGVSPAMEAVKMMEKEMPTPMTIEMGADERQAALDALDSITLLLFVLAHGDDQTAIDAEGCGQGIPKIRAALQLPRVDPKPKEECEKFALIEIRLNDDGTYKYSRSGAMRCSDILKCINYHCGVNEMQSPRVPVIDAFERIIDALVSYQVHSGLGHEHVYMDIVNCRAALQKKSEKTSLSSTSPVRDALSSQTEAACAVRVPVIPLLKDAIKWADEYEANHAGSLIEHEYRRTLFKAARAYAELQKGKTK